MSPKVLGVMGTIGAIVIALNAWQSFQADKLIEGVVMALCSLATAGISYKAFKI